MSNDFEKNRLRLSRLKTGKGVQYLLDEGYRILGNPIVLFDTSFNILAFVEDIVTDDWLWNEITAGGPFSQGNVDFFDLEKYTTFISSSDTVVRLNSDGSEGDGLVGRLLDRHGVSVGNVGVIACLKSFDEGDMHLIEQLSALLSAELQGSEFYRDIGRVYQEFLLCGLIKGRVKGSEKVRAENVELFGPFDVNRFLAVVDIVQCENTLTQMSYFRDLFKKIQAEYEYYIHLNYIVILLNTEDGIVGIERDLGKLNAFFLKYKIYAGVSGGFHDLFSLQDAYLEAVSSLQYGLKSQGNQRIFRFDDIRVEHFLNQAKTTGDIREIFSPIVFLIQEYDRKHSTPLLKLLYTYLLNGKDILLTCEKVRITQEELLRHLKTLESKFGIEWKNGNMLNNIFISIKMLDGLPMDSG